MTKLARYKEIAEKKTTAIKRICTTDEGDAIKTYAVHGFVILNVSGQKSGHNHVENFILERLFRF